MVYIGSARLDERGKISGGRVGDQKQKSTPDYVGEVSQQKFYVHSKGWYILRPKDAKIAQGIANAMITACNNPHLGYNQNNRLGVIKYGTNSKVDTECDCSSLVRECVKEASGKDAGNFNTSNEKSMLMKTGLFDELTYYSGKTALKTGDILVTKTKGHTAVVTQTLQDTPNKSIEAVAREVIDGKWSSGEERRKRLTNAGYDYATIQKEVNRILKG